jgi:hypothetical protein
MVALDHHHLLMKQQHILLPHMTFKTFLTRVQKAQKYKEEQKNNCHLD